MIVTYVHRIDPFNLPLSQCEIREVFINTTMLPFMLVIVEHPIDQSLPNVTPKKSLGMVRAACEKRLSFGAPYTTRNGSSCQPPVLSLRLHACLQTQS
jgi:hypothetical protein